MDAARYIKKFVHICGPRDIFTTRDLLNYGSRAAIDQTLYRMVKTGYIIRLARGVFVKAYTSKETFSALEIAKIKAESFGRRIAEHAKDIAHKLHLLPDGNKNITFATDGGSSSFLFGTIRIYFKKTSLKKMFLPNSKVVQVIKALTYIGKHLFDIKAVRAKADQYSYLWPTKREFYQENAFMPSWLVDSFALYKSTNYCWTGIIKHRPVRNEAVLGETALGDITLTEITPTEKQNHD